MDLSSSQGNSQILCVCMWGVGGEGGVWIWTDAFRKKQTPKKRTFSIIPKCKVLIWGRGVVWGWRGNRNTDHTMERDQQFWPEVNEGRKRGQILTSYTVPVKREKSPNPAWSWGRKNRLLRRLTSSWQVWLSR